MSSISGAKFNFDTFKVDQSYEPSAEKEINRIPVQKPHKNQFIRYTGKSFPALVIEDKEASEVYLIHPNIASEVAESVVSKTLYLCIDKNENYFLYPVKNQDPDGNLDSWNRSAHLAIERSKETWLKVVSNRYSASYDIYIAKGDLGDPNFDDLSMENALEIAFQGKIVSSLDHPIIKKIRGEI